MANGISGIPVQGAGNGYSPINARRENNDAGAQGDDRGTSARTVAAATQGGNPTATRGSIINITA
jgi:hypothetical protein